MAETITRREIVPVGVSAARPRRRRSRGLAPGRRIPYARLLGPVLLLGIWCLASGTGALDPRTLPAPWTVVHTGQHLWSARTLPADILASLRRAGYGFLIGASAGVVLALAAGLSRI